LAKANSATSARTRIFTNKNKGINILPYFLTLVNPVYFSKLMAWTGQASIACSILLW